jgi:hypothetical protein
VGKWEYRHQQAQLAIEMLNNNEALGMDSIPAELLRHGGEEVINKIHRLVVKSMGGRKNTIGVQIKYYMSSP